MVVSLYKAMRCFTTPQWVGSSSKSLLKLEFFETLKLFLVLVSIQPIVLY
jgi:hypothetical protein